MIFLDNASTTQVCESAIQNLVHYSTISFYNPSANYSVGYENFKKIVETKQLICEKLNIKFNNNIIFTGSATEASNLAIFGSYRKNWKKAVFSMGEHPSVYNSAIALQEKGVEIIFVNLQKNGEINYEELELILDENVNFISIMQVSNETGAINDMEKIYKIKMKKCPNAILHCDGVQAFGKIETNLQKYPVDFFTISAHKFHGPKGLGVLYAKNPAKLKPIIYGGGQEYNLRSGTENLASIMALNSTLQDNFNINKNLEYVKTLNNAFKTEFFKTINKEIKVNLIENENLSPYIINLSFEKIKGQVLQNLCDQNGLLVSTGSACSSKKSGNRILENIGLNKELIIGNIRVSFSKYTTLEEVIKGANILANSANELWRIAK